VIGLTQSTVGQLVSYYKTTPSTWNEANGFSDNPFKFNGWITTDPGKPNYCPARRINIVSGGVAPNDVKPFTAVVAVATLSDTEQVMIEKYVVVDTRQVNGVGEGEGVVVASFCSP